MQLVHDKLHTHNWHGGIELLNPMADSCNSPEFSSPLNCQRKHLPWPRLLQQTAGRTLQNETLRPDQVVRKHGAPYTSVVTLDISNDILKIKTTL